MKHLFVSAIEPYSLGDECASVTLRSDQTEIVVFCHGCTLEVGDSVENRLYILDGEINATDYSDCTDEIEENRSLPKLERIGHYAYRGAGSVIDQAEGLVEVLGFVIEFGDTPYGGDVEFKIDRLDIRPTSRVVVC